MTEIRLYASSPRPGEGHVEYVVRMLSIARSGNTTSLLLEHANWLKERGVYFYVESRKLDEYLILENDEDATAFKLKFGCYV